MTSALEVHSGCSFYPIRLEKFRRAIRTRCLPIVVDLHWRSTVLELLWLQDDGGIVYDIDRTVGVEIAHDSGHRIGFGN